MVLLERYELVPLQFKFYSVYINQPSFCFIINIEKRRMPILYPITAKFQSRPEYIVIKNPFRVSNLFWVRHIEDHPTGNLMTMAFTLGNLRQRKISYRLWGKYSGQVFDITPYFRHYYYRHIPREIPPLDIKEKAYLGMT